MTNSSVLLLNTTYEPLGVVTIQRAVRLLFSGKAVVIHDNGSLLHSSGNKATKKVVEFPLPSIIRLLYYVTRRRKPNVALTKKNVLLRDNYHCGYCDVEGGPEMTVDHIFPKSRGGKSTWQNLVAACSRCNSRKRDRTPEEAGMHLLRTPKKPTYIPFFVIKRHTMPDEWLKYLNLYSVSIEERIG